jgi:GNAT superfamily N-acetyltransferase
MDRLFEAALAVNQDNLALGNEAFEAAGARFVRNAAYPSIYDANHVDDVTASSPAEIEALLERAEDEFAGCPHLRFDVDARTPPEFEARLKLDGRYSCTETLVMVLQGELRGQARPFEVQHIVDDEGWKAFGALHALDWTEGADDSNRRTPEAGQAWAAVTRLKSPPLRFWLGYIEGVPRGYLSSWEGLSGVGQVETLFVHPDFRHRGLATALLHHCVRDARALGAGPVAIAADAADTPKQMYADMGWRPVAVKREYLLLRDAPAS